jgi:hypothetical protein
MIEKWSKNGNITECALGSEECQSIQNYCNINLCTEFNPPKYTSVLKWILLGNWSVSFLVTAVGIFYMYTLWVKRKELVDEWPYNVVVYQIPTKKLKGFIPKWMIKFGLFLKVVPSLVIDVIDILFDTIYFGEFVANGIINSKIHIRPHIYAILFAFQITGTVKNVILVHLANKQINGKRATEEKRHKGSIIKSMMMDENESSLVDTNSYMYINFYQTILAFCLQDGPEAFMQYFYIDKYVEEFNLVLFLASSARCLMSCRVMYIFFFYVKNFLDPAYHNEKVRALVWSMVLVKCIITAAHTLRTIAVFMITRLEESLFDERINSCIEFEEDKIYQAPWSQSCLNRVDDVLLCLCGASVVGVAVGIFVARHQGKKVYNQSHYSGRNGMVTVGKNQNFERNKKSTMSETTDSFDTTTDSVPPSRLAVRSMPKRTKSSIMNLINSIKSRPMTKEPEDTIYTEDHESELSIK